MKATYVSSSDGNPDRPKKARRGQDTRPTAITNEANLLKRRAVRSSARTPKAKVARSNCVGSANHHGIFVVFGRYRALSPDLSPLRRADSGERGRPYVSSVRSLQLPVRREESPRPVSATVSLRHLAMVRRAVQASVLQVARITMKILRQLFFAILASLTVAACSGAPGQTGQDYSPMPPCCPGSGG